MFWVGKSAILGLHYVLYYVSSYRYLNIVLTTHIFINNLGYVLGFDAYMSGAFTELLLADVCLLCAVLGGKRVY